MAAIRIRAGLAPVSKHREQQVARCQHCTLAWRAYLAVVGSTRGLCVVLCLLCVVEPVGCMSAVFREMAVYTVTLVGEKRAAQRDYL
jgi:hypothetical protein